MRKLLEMLFDKELVEDIVRSFYGYMIIVGVITGLLALYAITGINSGVKLCLYADGIVSIVYGFVLGVLILIGLANKLIEKKTK